MPKASYISGTAKGEEWPLYSNWWLHIVSEPHKHEAFDNIKIEAHGREGYKRTITEIMVPKIDGFVCESHSFIGLLIDKNIKAQKSAADKLVSALENISNPAMYGMERTCWSDMAKIALAEYRGDVK